MDDGAKKAGGVFAALLVGIGTFAARGLDDCARVGAGAARYGDDVVVAGAGGADELARFGRGAAYGEGLAGTGDDLGRFGDDLASGADDLVPGYGQGRTGSSFGGAQFPDEVALTDDLAGGAPALSDDAIETAAELLLDLGADAAELALEEDEEETIPVLREDARSVVPDRVRVIALGSRYVESADVTVGSLASLDATLARGDASTLAVVVLPAEHAGLRGGRSDAAVLVRAAQLGRRAILMVCDPMQPERAAACVDGAAQIAREASAEGADGLSSRLTALRDASPWARDIALHRLHRGRGDTRPRVVSSEGPAAGR